MSGHIRGVQARIEKKCASATYVHCRSHNLNLAVCDTCAIPVIRNMYTIANKILTFIRSSPKCLQVYIDNGNNTRLKRFCPTRWTYHSESIHVLFENFGTILETLDVLKSDSYTHTRNDATSLSNSISSFEFLVALVVVEAPMQHLAPLCSALQNQQCDLVKASSMALSVIGMLRENRNSDEYFQSLWNKACTAADDEGISDTKPRVSAKQTRRSNTSQSASMGTSDTPQQYWKLNLFLPFLDHLIVQLENRLTNNIPRLNAQYLVPCNISLLDETMWTSIKVLQ